MDPVTYLSSKKELNWMFRSAQHDDTHSVIHELLLRDALLEQRFCAETEHAV